MKKLTEQDKLKYWLDAELSIMKALVALVLLQLIESGVIQFIVILYIVGQLLYAAVRISYLATFDPDYLKVPKR